MKSHAFKIIYGILAASILLAYPCSMARANDSNQHIRALVDASKDGGTWWAGEASKNFNPQLPHQGKSTADDMRSRGWEVTELPRGAVVTSDLLLRFDIVIRPTPFFPYAKDEISAYRQAVAAGVRLLIMGSPGGDALAESFSIHFDSRSRISPVRKILPHPLTIGLDDVAPALSDSSPGFKVRTAWSFDIPWVAVNDMPREAAALVWIGDQESEVYPVLGCYPYFKGYVVFIGASLGIKDQGRGWRDKIFTFLGQYSADALQQSLTASPILVEAAGPHPPALITPENGAILPQPQNGPWNFAWEKSQGARKYQIIVLGGSAATPLVDIEINSNAYSIPQQKSGYIIDRNRFKWMWRIRAKDNAGQWGDWSPPRYFDVAP
jgi:hypothetical protein